MTVKDARQAALLRLLDEDPDKRRGGKSRLAARLGKKPAQISQWLSGFRTIEEGTARDIERKAKKPHLWMDQPMGHGSLPQAHSALSPGIDLQQAIGVMAEALQHVAATRRPELVKVFELLTDHPEEPDYLARLAKLLGQALPSALPEKRQSNGR
jgi:transcriptional regulator with XRE-family HTH domain